MGVVEEGEAMAWTKSASVVKFKIDVCIRSLLRLAVVDLYLRLDMC